MCHYLYSKCAKKYSIAFLLYNVKASKTSYHNLIFYIDFLMAVSPSGNTLIDQCIFQIVSGTCRSCISNYESQSSSCNIQYYSQRDNIKHKKHICQFLTFNIKHKKSIFYLSFLTSCNCNLNLYTMLHLP